MIAPPPRWLAPVLSILLVTCVGTASVIGQETKQPKESTLQITTTVWGKTPQGEEVHLFKLTSADGAAVELTDWGGTLVSVHVPDTQGKLANVNLGFPALEGYLQRHPFFGSTVGRFCNRIGLGKFSLDGRQYTLATNNMGNHLHGGNVGFDAQLWRATEVRLEDRVGVRLSLVSPDGDEGYPGRLETTALYTWNNDHELTCTFIATTDKPTVVNLTNHAYWNLAGAGSGKILEHLLEVDADQYLEVNETLVPTGKFLDVAGTPLDFRKPRAIGESIDQLPATKGYDHCYCVRGPAGQLRRGARAVDPRSGRAMEVWTTQPGMQLYTGNHLGGNAASGGFGGHDGFCLETQHYPDAPNRPEFPSTRLDVGRELRETTVYRFLVDR